VERIEPDFEYEYDLGGPLDEIPGGATTALQGTPLVVIWHLTAQPPQGAVMRSPGPRYEPSNLAKARFNDAVRIARQALTGKTQLTIFGSMQNATYVTPPESDNTWIWQPASFPAFGRPRSLDAGKASAPQAHAAAHRINQLVCGRMNDRDARNPLVGTWRLVSWENQELGEKIAKVKRQADGRILLAEMRFGMNCSSLGAMATRDRWQISSPEPEARGRVRQAGGRNRSAPRGEDVRDGRKDRSGSLATSRSGASARRRTINSLLYPVN
jgi:hypothetical protein